MEKRTIKNDEANDVKMEQGRKFSNDTPRFSEELSDGGVRNEMAEAQLKRISTDTREV